MSASDSLASLTEELRAMSPRAQRAILRSLTNDERAILADHAEDRSNAGAIEAGSSFSPWLAGRIRQTRSADALDPMNPMTSAARQALLRCADDITGSDSARSARPVQASGRSLFDAFGGFMSPRGAGR
jgi:hypothetical protein